MTLHRIEHAVVMDTDDIPGRGGYAVVGMSPGVTQVERAFVAANFGISDYLHDPKTEDRVFYSFFRVPGGRRAFVRRFARGGELRRNNTQRRLVVHTLLLDDEVYRELAGLPWLLLNARDVLRREIAIDHEGAALARLEWNTDDGATTGIASRLEKRLANLGPHAPLVERVMAALAEHKRVVLPQEPVQEWATVLAWSMLPWRDREELPWTQHDSMNIGGVSFALANAVSETATVLGGGARFAGELVRMNIASEESWRDLQERTARHPLSVRRPREVESWLDWRDALIRLRRHDLGTPEHEVVGDMRKLAATAQRNPDAPWIDGEEVLQLIWPNVPAAIAQGRPAELAVTDWGGRLQQSELGAVIFRAAPARRWLDRAADDVGADSVVRFFLAGTEGEAESRTTRTAIAEWVTDAHPHDVDAGRLARLALRLSADRSTATQALLETLLETDEGLGALHALMVQRTDGAELLHAAVSIALKRGHASTLPFLRDVFLSRANERDITAAVARDAASVLRDDPEAFLRLVSKVTPTIASELRGLVTQWVFREQERSVPLARELLRQVRRDDGAIGAAGPLAIALASAGEPASVWFAVVLRIARSTDARSEGSGRNDFLQTLDRLRERPLDLTDAMEELTLFLESPALRAGDAVRAIILLLRSEWAGGGSRFAGVLGALMARSARVVSWEEIVLAYAADHGRSRPRDVSALVAAFWMRVDPATVAEMPARTIELLTHVTGHDRRRFSAHWAKRVRTLPESAAAESLLHFVLGEQVTVSRDLQAELALRDIEQGSGDARTLNRLDASLFKLHGRKYVDIMAGAIDSHLGKRDAVSRTVRLLELLRSDEVMPTVRLVMERRVLPLVMKTLKRAEWREVLEIVREKRLVPPGVAQLSLAEVAGRTPLQWVMRAVWPR